MDRIRSLQDLETARAEALKQEAATAEHRRFQIRVSLGSCSLAAGAHETLEAIREYIRSHELGDVQIKEIGCIGLCALEPVVQVVEGYHPPVTYGRVIPAVVQRIFNEHIERQLIVQEYVVENI